jgi:hypothetical protein
MLDIVQPSSFHGNELPCGRVSFPDALGLQNRVQGARTNNDDQRHEQEHARETNPSHVLHDTTEPRKWKTPTLSSQGPDCGVV